MIVTQGSVCRCPQWGTVIKHLRCGADWTMCFWVITTSCSKVNHAATDTPLNENSQFSQWGITKVWSTFWPSLRWEWSTWWRLDYNWILACWCLQAGTLIKHIEFGVVWTMCALVITSLLPVSTPFAEYDESLNPASNICKENITYFILTKKKENQSADWRTSVKVSTAEMMSLDFVFEYGSSQKCNMYFLSSWGKKCRVFWPPLIEHYTAGNKPNKKVCDQH